MQNITPTSESPETIEHIIPKEELEGLRRQGHCEIQIEVITEFIRPLCKTARIYSLRVFERAKATRKDFIEVYTPMLREWENTWRYGTPDRLGDPDDVDPNGIGMKNACAFFAVYKELGITVKGLY